jgi:two-component system, cell cycle sensor histidine kinase and response regulator CckA
MERPGLILVVDDSDPIRHLICCVLADSGYAVLSAKDGDEALRAFRGSADIPDLLITDVVMPGSLNGVDLTRMLVGARGIRRGLVISGHPGAVRLDCLEQATGIRVPLLKKPFSPAELLELVKKLLRDTALEQGAA